MLPDWLNWLYVWVGLLYCLLFIWNMSISKLKYFSFYLTTFSEHRFLTNSYIIAFILSVLQSVLAYEMHIARLQKMFEVPFQWSFCKKNIMSILNKLSKYIIVSLLGVVFTSVLECTLNLLQHVLYWWSLQVKLVMAILVQYAVSTNKWLDESINSHIYFLVNC